MNFFLFEGEQWPSLFNILESSHGLIQNLKIQELEAKKQQTKKQTRGLTAVGLHTCPVLLTLSLWKAESKTALPESPSLLRT